jgi:hypothetical protein
LHGYVRFLFREVHALGDAQKGAYVSVRDSMVIAKGGV